MRIAKDRRAVKLNKASESNGAPAAAAAANNLPSSSSTASTSSSMSSSASTTSSASSGSDKVRRASPRKRVKAKILAAEVKRKKKKKRTKPSQEPGNSSSSSTLRTSARQQERAERLEKLEKRGSPRLGEANWSKWVKLRESLFGPLKPAAEADDALFEYLYGLHSRKAELEEDERRARAARAAMVAAEQEIEKKRKEDELVADEIVMEEGVDLKSALGPMTIRRLDEHDEEADMEEDDEEGSQDREALAKTERRDDTDHSPLEEPNKDQNGSSGPENGPQTEDFESNIPQSQILLSARNNAYGLAISGEVPPTRSGRGRGRRRGAINRQDHAEKILMRKRISHYDCRKTPSGGIIPSQNSVSPPDMLGAHLARPPSLHSGDGDADLDADADSNGSDSTYPPGAGGLQGSSFTLSPKWCRNCDCKHEAGVEHCPLKKPKEVFTDSVIDFSTKGIGAADSMHGSETEGENGTLPTGLDLSKSFAKLSLPAPLWLAERSNDGSNGLPEDNCSGGGNSRQLAVLARVPIQAYTQFGPLQGEPIMERDVPEDFDMKDLWQVFTEDNRRLYVSTVNPEKSNWLRYLRPAPQRQARNVAAIVRQDQAYCDSPIREGRERALYTNHARLEQLYFVTLRDLDKNEELLYWIDDPDLMWTKKRAEKRNCGGCNLRFSHPLYYRLHCTVFHDPQFSLTIRKYHCKVCGLAVLGKDNIVKHALNEHAGKGAYQCQFCKKYFLRLNYLDMHRTYGCSSNPGRTRPLCNICGKKFCQPQKLKIHMKRMHSDNSETLVDFKCPICHKILGSRNALQRHRREVHSEPYSALELPPSSSSTSVNDMEVNHQSTLEMSAGLPGGPLSAVPASSARVACEKCGRTFKNKSNLKIHMLTHSGVKPFGCKIEGCKGGFTTKQCLQFHYRKTHGLTEDNMPKIEREIPYTLSAYSGGLVSEDNEITSTGGTGRGRGRRTGNPSLRGKRATSFGISSMARKSPITTGKKDVYQFDEDDSAIGSAESGRRSSMSSNKVSEGSTDPATSSNRLSAIDAMPQAPSSDRTSMLVLAALGAAEHDLAPKSSATPEATDKDNQDTGSNSEKDPDSAETTPSRSPRENEDSSVKKEDEVNIPQENSSTSSVEHEETEPPPAAAATAAQSGQPAQPSAVQPLPSMASYVPGAVAARSSDSNTSPSSYTETQQHTPISVAEGTSQLNHSAQSLVSDPCASLLPVPDSVSSASLSAPDSSKSDKPLYLPPISTFSPSGRLPPYPPCTSSYGSFSSEPLPPYSSLYSGLDMSANRGGPSSVPPPHHGYPRGDYTGSSASSSPNGAHPPPPPPSYGPGARVSDFEAPPGGGEFVNSEELSRLPPIPPPGSFPHESHIGGGVPPPYGTLRSAEESNIPGPYQLGYHGATAGSPIPYNSARSFSGPQGPRSLPPPPPGSYPPPPPPPTHPYGYF